MSVCIIGAGLSGLALAIKLKLQQSTLDVLVVSNRKSGNTVMAGQRFRPRVARDREDEREALVRLLQCRNNMVRTHAMERYADAALEELRFWTNLKPRDLGIDFDRLSWEERPEWFGPQWGRTNAGGNGRGKDVLQWLLRIAGGLGVAFLYGTALRINRSSSRIESIAVDVQGRVNLIGADFFVLAGGSIGGTIFHSTNVPIRYSPQHLLYEAGLDMVGSTLNMFHILGHSNSSGSTKVGCFETDRLSSADIFLRNDATGEFSIYDQMTTALLREHKAHYHFDDIARRFLAHGGVAQVRHSDESIEYGRVSHHYSHMAARTLDGVRVWDTENLFSIGDAAGTGYWSGFQVRFPGAALTNCLVTAKYAASGICEHATNRMRRVQISVGRTIGTDIELPEIEKLVRDTNTKFLLDISYVSASPAEVAVDWCNTLVALRYETRVPHASMEISLRLAKIFRSHCGALKEPIILSRSAERNGTTLN